MTELEKHLQKAEKYVSKNKIDLAIEEYKAAVELDPRQPDLLRNLADLCARSGETREANRYYGLAFDNYAEAKDAAKAVPLFRKSLQGTHQPPERYCTLGNLLQSLGKNPEAVEAYRTALALFHEAGDAARVLSCLEQVAGLEPDNPETQVELGEQAQKLRKTGLAARTLLRAGQLFRPDHPERALELLQRAYDLTPERTTALSLAQLHLERGRHAQAAELLLPFYADSADDAALLETLASALLAGKRLREAEEVLRLYYQSKPDTYERLFELAGLYCKARQVQRGVELLGWVQKRLFASKRRREFMQCMERIYRANPALTPLAEYVAAVFDEANEEGRYATVLGDLFGLYCQAGDYARAVEALECLIDIDPYDAANQRRLKQLQGKLDDTRLRAVAARITNVTSAGRAAVVGLADKSGEDAPIVDARQQESVLEDLMVQAEIFLQYALRAKAIEKLQAIHQRFPGTAGSNQRFYELCQQAQYMPQGVSGPLPAAGAPAPSATAPPEGPASGGTVRDLAKISEITHALYRQTTPKTILYTAVSELGKYLQASRCLGILGQPGTPASSAVEFCAAGVPRSPPAAVVKLLGLLTQVELDRENGAVLDCNLTPELKQAGAQSALAMPLIEKGKQQHAGFIVLSQADHARQWQPHEVYLLRTVADQVETAIEHTRLRSLMRKLSVADEGTGLLARSSYLDCLVSEVTRAKAQGAPLAVALLELDNGGQWRRQVGEATVQKFMQQAGEILLASVRQSDTAIRYTTTSLGLVLADTQAEKAQPVVEKLCKTLSALPLPGGNESVSFSAGVSEALIRPDYDPLDIVTEVINRVEFSLQGARRKGNAVVLQ
ncbi:MAG: tetratricopeptide repeat protein [Terriglobia bacterium]